MITATLCGSRSIEVRSTLSASRTFATIARRRAGEQAVVEAHLPAAMIGEPQCRLPLTLTLHPFKATRS